MYNPLRATLQQAACLVVHVLSPVPNNSPPGLLTGTRPGCGHLARQVASHRPLVGPLSPDAEWRPIKPNVNH